MKGPTVFHLEREAINARVTLVTLGGAASEAEFEARLEEIRLWLLDYEARGELAVLLIDPSAMTRLDASVRRVYGEWRAENIELIGKTVERAAYIANSSVWRGILTAVFWFARPIIPVKLVANRAAGLSWIERTGAPGDF